MDHENTCQDIIIQISGFFKNASGAKALVAVIIVPQESYVYLAGRLLTPDYAKNAGLV